MGPVAGRCPRTTSLEGGRNRERRVGERDSPGPCARGLPSGWGPAEPPTLTSRFGPQRMRLAVETAGEVLGLAVPPQDNATTREPLRVARHGEPHGRLKSVYRPPRRRSSCRI